MLHAYHVHASACLRARTQVFQRLLFPISCLANTAEEAVEIIRGLESNSELEVDSIHRFSQRALEHIDVRTSPDVLGTFLETQIN